MPFSPRLRPQSLRARPLRFETLEPRCLLSTFGQVYVTQVYHDLLQRPTDDPGLAFWASQIDQGGSCVSMVRELTAAPEFQLAKVRGMYQDLLSRNVDPGGLNSWLGAAGTGVSFEQIEANILGSPEYFQTRGGGTNSGFLSALYEDALGRPVDAGAAVFQTELQNGTNRATVAAQVLESDEGLQHHVANVYQQFLGRAPEAGAAETWVRTLQSPEGEQNLLAGVMGSPECQQQQGRTNAVIQWNQVLLDAIRADGTPPPAASRNMAIVQAAVYDAVNGLTHAHASYFMFQPGPADASPDVAAASAAHTALVALYPKQTAMFDAELRMSLAGVPDGPAKTDGERWGKLVASSLLMLRDADGSTQQVTYKPTPQPGVWRPTAPAYAPPLLPQWGQVEPFALTSDTQFVPPPPPAINSGDFALSLNEVQSLGAKNSAARTQDQTQIAYFWADNGGTATPPGHWNVIAEEVALQRGAGLEEDARLFAQLDFALADAGITAWNTKYTDGLWRPITAIQQAATANNPLITADPTWQPLLPTPPFPSYISGHSTFSAAAAAVLTAAVGPSYTFAATSDGMPGVTRRFTSFTQAADEAGRSRIYGGIHYQFDNLSGLTTGQAIGQYVAQRTLS